jgi:hypothetical protein
MTGCVGLRRKPVPNCRPRRGIPDPPCSASPSGVGSYFANRVAILRTTGKKKGSNVPRHSTPGYLNAHVASPVPPRPTLNAHAALSALRDKQRACQLLRSALYFCSELRNFRREFANSPTAITYLYRRITNDMRFRLCRLIVATASKLTSRVCNESLVSHHPFARDRCDRAARLCEAPLCSGSPDIVRRRST